MRVVTLTTDFGPEDAYVGQLKGALLSACADILPIDLTHAVPPWDVAAASRCLAGSFAVFPAGTIHLAVVDPGVGGPRRLVAASGRGHFFVGPDNGLFTRLLEDGVLSRAHEIPPPSSGAVSPTFHGRDVLAPAAGRLARGADLADLGPALALEELVRLAEGEEPKPTADGFVGRVLSVDHFGNVRTSFHPGRMGLAPARIAALEIGDARITTWVRAYHEAPPGALCRLVDSDGYVEIALNQGNAARFLGCAPGDAARLLLDL